MRPQLPCISRVPNELQSLGPLYPDSWGFGAAPSSPPHPPLPLPATDNTQNPAPSLGILLLLLPSISVASSAQLCQENAVSAHKNSLTCRGGRGWQRGGPGLSLELPFMDMDCCPVPGSPVLIQVRPRASCGFADPAHHPGGRAGGVEKSEPVAGLGSCLSQGLVPPPPLPPSSGPT